MNTSAMVFPEDMHGYFRDSRDAVVRCVKRMTWGDSEGLETQGFKSWVRSEIKKGIRTG